MKYKKWIEKTELERIWQYGKLQQFKQKNKCEKIACKYRTKQNGEKKRKHK